MHTHAEGSPARRDERQILVELLPAVLFIPEHAEGSAEPGDSGAQALASAFAAALLTGHMTVLPASAALEFTGSKRLVTCLAETTCQTELARLCALDYAVHARIEKTAGGTQAQLQLVDIEVGDVAATGAPACSGCDARQLGQKLADETAALITKAKARPRGRLEIRSEPADAEVLLDGRVIGRTPYSSAAWVGTHALLLRRTGSEPEQRRLIVTESQTTSLHVALTQLPQAPPPPPPPPPIKLRRVVRNEVLPRPRWRLITGGLLAGAGVVLLGIGGRALAISGTCGAPPDPPEAECARIYDTTSLGAGLAGVGGALVLGGGVMMALPGERRHIEELVP